MTWIKSKMILAIDHDYILVVDASVRECKRKSMDGDKHKRESELAKEDRAK